MKRVTRKDVAQYSGVSETVVSYVINNNRYVDQTKKEKILKAIEELGYRPNPVARALKGKETKHLLFIVDDLHSEYFGSILSEMAKQTEADGYIISLCKDDGNGSFINRVICWNFDGIIIGSATIKPEDIQRLISSDMPVVLLSINKYPEFTGNYGLIFTGLEKGAEKIVEKLQEKGRTRIAYATSKSPQGLPVNKNDFRYIGYIKALKNSEPIVIDGFKTEEELKEKLIQVFNTFHFDALICRTDTIAAEALISLQSIDVKIPEAVSIIGFNNTRMTKYTNPPLSSVDMNRKEIAAQALNLISRLKNGEKGVLKIELGTEIIIRSSF